MIFLCFSVLFLTFFSGGGILEFHVVLSGNSHGQPRVEMTDLDFTEETTLFIRVFFSLLLF